MRHIKLFNKWNIKIIHYNYIIKVNYFSILSNNCIKFMDTEGIEYKIRTTIDDYITVNWTNIKETNRNYRIKIKLRKAMLEPKIQEVK